MIEALPFVLGLLLVGFVVWMVRQERKLRAELRREYEEASFHRRARDCREYLYSANERPHVSLPRKRNETPWSYAKRFRDHAFPKMKPYPIWGEVQKSMDAALEQMRQATNFIGGALREQSFVTATIEISIWATRDEHGVVHRVGSLPHDGTKSFVLMCDPLRRMAPEAVGLYAYHQGPIITCIACMATVHDG